MEMPHSGSRGQPPRPTATGRCNCSALGIGECACSGRCPVQDALLEALRALQEVVGHIQAGDAELPRLGTPEMVAGIEGSSLPGRNSGGTAASGSHEGRPQAAASASSRVEPPPGIAALQLDDMQSGDDSISADS